MADRGSLSLWEIYDPRSSGRNRKAAVTPPATRLDPDRFFDRTSPGAHEWWYFDAISDDGRDALVIVWYAGLPFDPSFGVATLRHLKDPAKYPAPRALDHSAIGLSWYRDGRTMAYALNGHRAEAFRHRADPFAVEVATSRVVRDGRGYRLTVATPSVDGKAIRAELRFRPADATEPFERDLGTPDAPHNWILAAADCRVEGRVAIGGKEMAFDGRGYHDHNAGAEDLSIAMRRWEWGRVHHGRFTHIYYRSEPHRGPSQTLWIVCVDGGPRVVKEGQEFLANGPRRNVFGVRHHAGLRISDGRNHILRGSGRCVDDGPFYRRMLAPFESPVSDLEENPFANVTGFAELLDARNLHKPWFNWMIPYRLKWPKD
jgi:carotenoid 1,2-hydratase